MPTDSLFEKYIQLRGALAVAYEAPVWQSDFIDRLVHEIGEVEHELAGASKVAARRTDHGHAVIDVAASGLS